MKNKQKCYLPPYIVDPIISLQAAQQKIGWNITAFNLPSTWKKTKGEGVKVAILDSGCDLDHPDLKKNLLEGKNFVEPSQPPKDMCGHGTHVAGTIAAENNDVGMVGVAPECKIIPVKVLDANGNGNMANVAKAIRWAATSGADIISLSLGSPCKLQQVRKAIQYAAKRGIPTFCAAGNAGKTKEVFYPAAYPETIAIGSINENFQRSSFSNTGKNLDFMAPGDKIFSTYPPDWYSILSGTSMACPFAVGVAALLLSYTRTNNVPISLNTVEDYRKIFRQNTIPISNKKYAGNKFFQGFGIIDPRKFVEWCKKNNS